MTPIRLTLFVLMILAGCAPDDLGLGRPITADASAEPLTRSDARVDAQTGPETAVDDAPTQVDAGAEAAADAPSFTPDAPQPPDTGLRTTFPQLRVFVAPTWTESQRRGVWSGLGLLRDLVPSVVESDQAGADIGIFPATVQDCAVVAGDTYTRTAYADPRCFPTASGFDFPHAIAHLVLHHLGLRHVCVGPGESTTDCSPVPYGRGIMNVHFAESHTPARTRLGWSEGLSAFDRAEAQRVLSTETWRFP